MTMSRAGIGSLMRTGPAPGRAGLSHLARGEAVIPNAAMQADPMLRQRAMAAMASRGRNPMQYTVSGQNLRNPSTGARMFADLIYTENGWVDPSTGQAADFGGGAAAPSSLDNFYNAVAKDSDGLLGNFARERIAADPSLASAGGHDWNAALSSDGGATPHLDNFYRAVSNDRDGLLGNFAREQISADPSLASAGGHDWNAMLSSSGSQSNFTAPQTYDQWTQTRNPTGKNVPNTLFGQTQTAGSDSGMTGQGMQSPNVLAGQMPVPGQQWGTPGTALGFARDNTANDPSILKSGYSDISLSPSVYSGAFGGAGFAPQSGIAFSGGYNPGAANQAAYQQRSGGDVPFGFGNAFRY